MTPDSLKRIRFEAKVSAVLSLQHDDCLAYWGIHYGTLYRAGEALGLLMERCPIRDFDTADMRSRLPAAVSMLSGMLGRGHRVYVHCTAGMGRAPTVVLGYLTLVGAYSTDEAARLILKGRPEAVLNWEAYHGCIEDLVDRHRQAIEQRAYELYKAGVHNNARTDWYQSQTQILRSLLTHRTAVC